MPGNQDPIIITGYKTKVSYYGLPAAPAWTVVAVPFVLGLVIGLLV